jgi:hypothetical protein
MSKVKPKEEVFFLDPTNLAASVCLQVDGNLKIR